MTTPLVRPHTVQGRLSRLLGHLGAHWLIIIAWPDGHREVLHRLWTRWWAQETREHLRHDQWKDARNPWWDGAELIVQDAREIPADRWGECTCPDEE